MKTLALRFGEQFSPVCGTIEAHKAILREKGYVWYGKLGNPISDKNIRIIMDNDVPKILLICSGKTQRYWASIKEIQKVTPPLEGIPEYYRHNAYNFKTWFKIVSIEDASHDVMSRCTVISSMTSLSQSSRHSMSPVFLIEYK